MTAIYKNALLTFMAIAIMTFGTRVPAQTQVPIKTVKVTPETAEAEVGQQLKFTVTGYDDGGKPVQTKSIFWFATPSDIANVDTFGTATFFAPGEARVVAIVAGKPGVATVLV